MIGWLRQRLTYANVAATAALLLALGGTSYAAFTLPRDSVGSKQIRTGAVNSRHIDNRSIRLGDLGTGARRSLRGQRGPAGRPGVNFFAVVAASGGLLRGNATSGGHTVGGSGDYTVGFAEDVSACAYSATLGTADGTAVAPGRVTVTSAGGSVRVQTYDAAGSPADLPFHLLVGC
jgi:hypothetical protein